MEPIIKLAEFNKKGYIKVKSIVYTRDATANTIICGEKTRDSNNRLFVFFETSVLTINTRWTRHIDTF